MVSGGATPIGSRPVSTFGNPLVFKPSAAALRKAIERVEVSKVPKAVEEGDDGGYDVVRPQGERQQSGTSMECEVPLGVPLGDASSRTHKTGAEPMESEEPDYEELFYSAAEDVPAAVEPVYAVPMKKKLRDKLINVIGSVGGGGGGGGGGSSSGGSSGDVSQDRTPLPTPRNGFAIHYNIALQPNQIFFAIGTA